MVSCGDVQLGDRGRSKETLRALACRRFSSSLPAAEGALLCILPHSTMYTATINRQALVERASFGKIHGRHSRLRSGRASVHEPRLKISCNRNPFLLTSRCSSVHCNRTEREHFRENFSSLFFITDFSAPETYAFFEYISDSDSDSFI